MTPEMLETLIRNIFDDLDDRFEERGIVGEAKQRALRMAAPLVIEQVNVKLAEVQCLNVAPYSHLAIGVSLTD
jgi:hypothetical protein